MKLQKAEKGTICCFHVQDITVILTDLIYAGWILQMENKCFDNNKLGNTLYQKIGESNRPC